ncbi:MAG: site-specific integrase [Pseudomonadota bacterium]
MTWKKTDYSGVYVRDLQNQKYGIGKDYNISIRFQFAGKNYQEVVGRASKDVSPKKAFLLLSELKANQKAGTPPFTLQEKRIRELERQETEKADRGLEEKVELTFSNLFEKHYLPQQKQDKKLSWRDEVCLYNNHIKAVIGDKRLIDIAPIHLERIKSNMGKSELSPRYVSYALAVIRQAFNFATNRDFFTGSNPIKKIKMPVADNRRMRFLAHEEAQRLLDEIRLHSVLTYRITLISLHCGLRFGEISGLTWQDLNFQNDTILIRNPKNGRTRVAFMTEVVKAMFLEMEPGKAGDFVFQSTGNKGRIKDISETFNRAVNKIGLNDSIVDSRLKVVFHTCRHSFASWLVTDGADLFTVRELMGHKSIAMTERYSHLSPDTLRKAVKSMETAIRPKQEADVVQFRK